ncbi:LOW QUALITY PROTEIN: hypothetical protein RJ639_036426 [Escallonia herrerae]|uniref:Protein kinase domain-containing protein n=1 Tax=Escallonia herrerae TaxID=1293975 RepID=A0AA88WSM5_9ASTE|nr:LOW QUALITY PROTEIN: hypothetical protein RJ639_036426 [Escallonia herrerae]
MRKVVTPYVYVGFTASTGTVSETHRVLSWNFTSYKLPGDKAGDKISVILFVVIPVFLLLLLLAIFAIPAALRAHRRESKRIGKKEDLEMLTRNAANAPKMFTYRQLSKATRNFNKENLLGSGGFGGVYKGVLSDPPTTIAVKKISSTSKQDWLVSLHKNNKFIALLSYIKELDVREYLAEICTIGRLKHKNLVQLQGWCHDRVQLLLVYDYMPNGSLDHFIGKNILDWKTRYDILMGLASVLVYLHEECGSPVVHRDVKPYNVMLDSNYNAHLGDFGLARLLQNDTSITTMVAGTPGYLAPEVSYTGRATPESDVYSFGMVVLEVVCGKRSRGIMDENSLVEFSLYETGTLLKCVDQRLEGNYDEEQVKRTLTVGLACLHPDHLFRPRMRKVVQISMNPNEPLMSLPESRPSAVCVSLYSSSASSTTDFASTSGPHQFVAG